MRVILALCLLAIASGCSNRLDPVFDGGVYDPIYGATDQEAARTG